MLLEEGTAPGEEQEHISKDKTSSDLNKSDESTHKENGPAVEITPNPEDEDEPIN